MWSLRLKKKTNFKGTFFFWGYGSGGGGVVLELGRLWEGETTFVWLIHTRLEGGLLVTAFQHGLFLAEPLAQHILIIILLLLTHL